MINKRGFEFSFSIIFAILAGIFIIAIAIYTTTQFIHVSKYKIDTETAKKLSIIFSPLETSIEAEKTAYISFNSETKIFNECEKTGTFGWQEFSLSTKSGVGDEWQEPGGEIRLRNKYIFSDEVQGKKVYMFSMPFETGYKVASLTMMYSDKYCFKNPSNEIEDNLIILGNVEINATCQEDSKKICFGNGMRSRDCDINVEKIGDSYDEGYVTKDREQLYYYKNLLYAAIFSSPEIYECNVERLMGRAEQLAYLYAEESNFLEGRDCHTGLYSDFLVLAQKAQLVESSEDLKTQGVYDKSLEIEEKAGFGECLLWNLV
ncbi:MAG: hypothetical protein ABIH72_03640 [archaeon]